MNEEKENIIMIQLKSLTPTKQGMLIIIISLLLFFSMFVLNGNIYWNTSNEYYEGVIGWGLNMAAWSIISLIGIAIGLIRIFVLNKMK